MGPLEWCGLCAESIALGRQGASKSLKGRVKERVRVKSGALLSTMCCMVENPPWAERKTFLFSLLPIPGERQGEENWVLVLWAGSSIWPFCLGGVRSCFLSLPCSSSFPKLWRFEVRIWGVADFALSLPIQAWCFCVLGLLINCHVFKEKREFMEEPVLFSLRKIPVPHLECLALIAAWRLGELLLVLAYICFCCLEREMGLLWAPGDCETNMFVMAQTASSCRHWCLLICSRSQSTWKWNWM